MSFKPTGFTDYVNAQSYGLTPVAMIATPPNNYIAFPIGSTTITAMPDVFSAIDVGRALVAFSANTNFGDLWTTIASYNPQSTGTVTSVAVNGSNQVTILVSNSFVVGQQVTFAVTTATFLNTVQLSIVSRTGSQIVCAATAGDGSTNPPFTNSPYGPTADTGTVTGLAYIAVANAAVADMNDSVSGKAFVAWGPNANTGGHPSFTDCIPAMTAAITAAADAGVSLYIPSGTYAYNNVLTLDNGALDPLDTIPALIGAGSGVVTFIANNPASAAPQGFLNVDYPGRNLSVSGLAVYGNALPVGTAPTSSPYAEVTIWTLRGTVDDILIGDTPFQYGLHVRASQGSCRNIYDYAVSYYELDGAFVDNCTATAMEFSLTVPAGFTGQGEGGIVRQGVCNAFSAAHANGVLSCFNFEGNPSVNNSVMFENCLASGGSTNLLIPVGFSIENSVLVDCTAEDLQTGFLLSGGIGSGNAALYGCVANNTSSGCTLACFVASGGDVPWLHGVQYFVGQTTIDPAGHTQKVTVAGVSGGSLPAWNDAGGNTTDGGVTWHDEGTLISHMATGVKFSGCIVNGTAPGYILWNTGFNIDIDILSPAVATVPMYSSHAPIILSGLNSTQSNLVVYSIGFAGEEYMLPIKYYLETTQAGTGGTVTLSFNWKDPAGHAQSYSVPTTLSLTSTTGFVSGTLPIFAGGATDVTATMTVAGATGTPLYGAYVGVK
jgi:hypothetical protein